MSTWHHQSSCTESEEDDYYQMLPDPGREEESEKERRGTYRTKRYRKKRGAGGLNFKVSPLVWLNFNRHGALCTL